jgi:Zn-dependent metalloprotease
MSKRYRISLSVGATLFFLAVFLAGTGVNGAEPERGEQRMEAVTPADELEIRAGPVDAPRELKRKPRRVPKAHAPFRGILQAASHEGATARRDLNAHADTVRAFLHGYRPYLRLDDPEAELELQRQFTDTLQRTHFRYSQRYQGLSVWPAGLNVHLDRRGNVDLMNGSYIPTPREINIHPTIEEDRALATARAKVPKGEQAQVGQQELIIYAPAQGAPRLAWKFRFDVALDARWIVVIDAQNSSLLGMYNDVRTFTVMTESGVAQLGQATLLDALQSDGPVTGSGIDLFGQRRPLNVWQEVDGRFYLIDTSKPMFKPAIPDGYIGTYDAAHQTSGTFRAVNSAQRESGWLADGVSAAFNLSKIYDYYRLRHGRNSIDARGGKIIAFVRYGVKVNNAAWVSSEHVLIFGDAKRYAGALDIVAHEATHGVSAQAAGFIYQDQSGALTESFSDIFGENVEAYVIGAADWQNGESLGKPARSLKNPSSLVFLPGHPYPSKMSQYVSGAILDKFQNRDNGGVHINSTIISHAYYLLAAGLKGAIGLKPAEKIFYRALTIHLSPNSQFLDARLACIQAAEELYGATSMQVKKVAAAFDAVEIFDNSGLLFERSSWKRVVAP